ncbi:MAG: substrate-binding domain-containing protein [Myxococcales bacterium]|nr:substrate-binding domain-containing protein [Myxococcales bacterium]
MLRNALGGVLGLAIGLAAVGCKREAPSPASGSDAAPAQKTLRIAVIPKGTTHEFWKSVHAGAVKASRELGVEIVWKGPLKEDDLKQQIDLVQSFTAQAVSGIVLAPLNDKALVSSVKSATEAKIPVVIFDSDLASKDHVSFVATDNRAAGKLGCEHLAKQIKDKGAAIVLRYQEGSASTNHREEGCIEALKAAGVTIASDNQYGGATTESAHKASESLLLAQGAAAGKIAGVFTPNESTTFGMLRAIEKADLSGKLRFVGFDASDKLVAGVAGGAIEGLVLQDPFNMGYLAVKTMVSHIKGEKVERRIDTGSKLITKVNMNEPDMLRLLKPELGEWLNE